MNSRQMLELLEKHPFVEKIKAENQSEVLEMRQGAVKRIELARRAAELVIPGLEVELATLENERAAHDEQRKTILERLRTAQRALTEERKRLDYEVCQAEAALHENYDQRIDEAISFFRDRFDVFRSKKIDTQTRLGDRDLFTESQ